VPATGLGDAVALLEVGLQHAAKVEELHLLRHTHQRNTTKAPTTLGSCSGEDPARGRGGGKVLDRDVAPASYLGEEQGGGREKRCVALRGARNIWLQSQIYSKEFVVKCQEGTCSEKYNPTAAACECTLLRTHPQPWPSQGRKEASQRSGSRSWPGS